MIQAYSIYPITNPPPLIRSKMVQPEAATVPGWADSGIEVPVAKMDRPRDRA